MVFQIKEELRVPHGGKTSRLVGLFALLPRAILSLTSLR